GVVDGRNVWRANLEDKLSTLEEIRSYVHDDQLIVQPSSSLLHVPVTKALEEKIDSYILGGLSFADEKLAEVVTLTKGINDGATAIASDIQAVKQALDDIRATYRSNDTIRQQVANLTEADATRQGSAAERQTLQTKQFDLPVLPTTTIGSLPQTS